MPMTVPVTADNFARAETDMYFGMLVKRGGGVGRFDHLRQLHSIEGPGVRPNRVAGASSPLMGPVPQGVRGQ